MNSLLRTVLLLLLATGPVFAASAPTLSGGEGGALHLIVDGEAFCTFSPYLADASWNSARAVSVKAPPEGASGLNRFFYTLPFFDLTLEGTLQVRDKKDGVETTWDFSAKQEIPYTALAVATEFPVPTLAGGTWATDNAQGVFPEIYHETHLHHGKTRSLTLTFPDQRVLKFTFAEPTAVGLQDNREWNDAVFTVRVGEDGGPLVPPAHRVIGMIFSFGDGLSYRHDLPSDLLPVTLKAGDEWIPLKEELEIAPGSALDLTSQGFTDGPCGAKGRLITTSEGHFVCAGEPSRPKRFYGINLCFSASFLSHAETDRLLDRLVRLGYNTVRIHHHENQMSKPEYRPGFDWAPEKIDQLDYLMAGCGKRGLWITTDLFVSRPVSGEQIGLPEKLIPMAKYKVLVPVYEPAYQDWALFTRKFLDRVNPYTGKRVAEDPALAWISLINEGPAAHAWETVREIPEWTAAWNRWLAARYATREELFAALPDLTDKEDAKAGTVALPGGLSGHTPRVRLCQVFVADTERASVTRMRTLLRDELHCPALLTDQNNAGPEIVPLQAARDDFDYVDEHFYVDHPQFLEKPWRLPSRCGNTNPIAAGALGGAPVASARLWGKPFVCTEYNYSGPGRFRGVGGILTGAMAAIQDWDGVWRFDYSSTSKNLFEPDRMNYFDLVSDPLNQNADRLAIFLYLRGDLPRASSRLALLIPRPSLRAPPKVFSVAVLQSLVWKTQIGSLIVDEKSRPPGQMMTFPIAEAQQPQAILSALDSVKDKGEPGGLTLHPGQRLMVVNTPRSAGGYANPGKVIEAPGAGVKIDELTTGATVFVNSLDASPIKHSPRLLVTHLTDLQNTDIRYGEGGRQTLLDWGTLPHLVRSGSATVHLALAQPETYTVWGLSSGGTRQEKIEAKVIAGELVFTVNVQGKEGARMLYEVAVK